MTELYITNIIDYTTSIEPKDINKNINATLSKRLRNEIEGKCIKEGYVKKGSIKIVNRSLGEILSSHFNGTILYHIKFKADICNPVEGMIIDVKVVNINKMGVLAEYGDEEIPPLVILLAKQHHIDNDDFDALKLHDTIRIKVIGKRYEYGDSQISIIGVLSDDTKDKIIKLKKVSSDSSISTISEIDGSEQGSEMGDPDHPDISAVESILETKPDEPELDEDESKSSESKDGVTSTILEPAIQLDELASNKSNNSKKISLVEPEPKAEEPEPKVESEVSLDDIGADEPKSVSIDENSKEINLNIQDLDIKDNELELNLDDDLDMDLESINL